MGDGPDIPLSTKSTNKSKNKKDPVLADSRKTKDIMWVDAIHFEPIDKVYPICRASSIPVQDFAHSTSKNRFLLKPKETHSRHTLNQKEGIGQSPVGPLPLSTYIGML